MSEDDEIRRLLAEARHTDPIPPDVAGRMDGVIADLRADRPVRPGVVDLDAARRRRRARALLVAAAVVVVAGIGIDRLRDTNAGGASSADSAAGGATSDTAQPRAEAQPPRDGEVQDFAFSRAPRVSRHRFAQQAAALQAGRRAGLDGVTSSDAQSSGRRPLGYDASKSVRCAAPGRGRLVPVRYDGAPGLLVYRPPRGDTQVVDLVLCGHPGIRRTITLPAP